MANTPSTMIHQLLQGDAAALANPYPLYHAMRSVSSVVRTEERNGSASWHVLDYEQVAKAFRDPSLSAQRDMGARQALPIAPFTEQQRERLAFSRQTLAQMMLNLDPPDHTRLRKLVAKAFTPRMVEALRPRVQEIVDHLLRSVEPTGMMDIVTDLAYPLPTLIIIQLLGVPASDVAVFKRWSQGLIAVRQTAMDHTSNAVWEMADYFRTMIAQRRMSPQDDLMSALVLAKDQDDALSEEEIISQCHLLLVAGHETTTYALGSSVLALLRHPTAWKLLGDISIETAVEELLRYESPFQVMTRKACIDFEMAGQLVHQGEYVWLWIGAANHDPAQFADLDELQLQRTSNHHLAHLAFGGGMHYCLGAALARLELQVTLRTLRSRYPHLHLIGEEVAWREHLPIRGPKALSVAFGL